MQEQPLNSTQIVSHIDHFVSALVLAFEGNDDFALSLALSTTSRTNDTLFSQALSELPSALANCDPTLCPQVVSILQGLRTLNATYPEHELHTMTLIQEFMSIAGQHQDHNPPQ